VLEEEAKAELRRRVSARPERLPRIYDDGHAAFVRLFPRRADPEPADAHRLMKTLPGLVPSCIHIARGPRPENLPEALLAPGLRVGGELDPAVHRDLLESFGEELDQEGARLFGTLRGDAHGHTAKE
jgi:hypothetical protein